MKTKTWNGKKKKSKNDLIDCQKDLDDYKTDLGNLQRAYYGMRKAYYILEEENFKDQIFIIILKKEDT